MLLFPTGIDELPAPFDPVGRERQRREFVDSNNSFVRMRSYDALGRLSATQICRSSRIPFCPTALSLTTRSATS